MPLEEKYLRLLRSVSPISDLTPAEPCLSRIYDRVVMTNEKINITSLTSPLDVCLKHLADSLSLFSLSDFESGLAKGKKVCDVGCGGGFPGLPVAAVFPDASITMIDSTEKKIIALRENAQALGLNGVFPLWGRGEELAGAEGAHRERYDFCISRAVARLSVLCELCLPFVSTGGSFIAMKGARAMEELEECRRGIGVLGGKLREVREIRVDSSAIPLDEFSSEEQEKILDFCSSARYLIVIDKKKRTPQAYPRKWAQMTKKPLC